MDPGGHLLPRGVEGELAIGGDGVCDGYLGRARLTAERFVPDPYGRRPGGRLYLTGDRARWALDGRLEYLGRRDQQVKIRGLRVELGEIEQVLGTHPAVAAAYVVVRGEAPAQTLVAYVRPATDEPPPAKDLAAHAATKLPSGLVPRAYVVLDEIPLTTSGRSTARGCRNRRTTRNHRTTRNRGTTPERSPATRATRATGATRRAGTGRRGRNWSAP